MICAMLNIEELGQSILFIVIEKDNLERMKKADPITLESYRNGGILGGPKYPNDFNLLIAYEEETSELYQLVKAGNPAFILRYLERGRVFDPNTDGKHHAIKLNKEPN
jgi:hypothetical protein